MKLREDIKTQDYSTAGICVRDTFMAGRFPVVLRVHCCNDTKVRRSLEQLRPTVVLL